MLVSYFNPTSTRRYNTPRATTVLKDTVSGTFLGNSQSTSASSRDCQFKYAFNFDNNHFQIHLLRFAISMRLFFSNSFGRSGIYELVNIGTIRFFLTRRIATAVYGTESCTHDMTSLDS